MIMSTGFIGAATRLAPTDLQRAADQLGVEPAHVQAIIDVETAGSGFDLQGRPRMLFEPHVFYRRLSDMSARANLNLAIKQGVAYANWATKPYPIDSYPRLITACQIDQDQALCSASWGMGQVMGGEFRALGYASVQDMVLAACESEANQLEMMVRFIEAHNLAACLVDKNWTKFAQRYNGPGAMIVYANRLEAAYTKITTVVKEV